FCNAVGLHLSPRAFRGWCQAEGIEASGLHDMARVLRATRQAAIHRCRIADCLDGDIRSIRALFARGFATPEGPPSGTSLASVCHAQLYVSAPRLIEAILLMLSSTTAKFPRS